jgi:hypothetical protein
MEGSYLQTNIMEMRNREGKMILRIPPEGGCVIFDCVEPPYILTWEELIVAIQALIASASSA